MKFTDDELSRVLTAHEAGGLKRFGKLHAVSYPACLIQAAKLVDHVYSIYRPKSAERETSFWFDVTYDPTWTTDEFLAQLVARSLA